MKKIFLRFLVLQTFLLLSCASSAQQPNVKRVVFQGFWWDFWNSNFPNKWANYLTELAPRLKEAGFDAIWIPPVYKNSSTNDVGYGPFDMYDLGDKYQKGGDSIKNTTRIGTKDELLRMIAVMHANGIEVIQDIVMNHNNGAGNNSGIGGQDPEPTYSMASNNGYKNFRFTSYATPLINDSLNDYFTRNGRWPKNYTNYHPNAGDNCITGDICAPYFGPDISYEATSIGQSTNIPATGSATIGGITRPYNNPAQPADYMRNSGRDWIMWFKKQTGADGMRWDAVKHFPVNVQEDYIYNAKYGVPDFAKGGQNMFCVGEWIGGTSELDAYVNNVKTGVAPGGVANEKHTGTFDFNLRGYGSTGGIYNMVMNQGGYDMQSLPGEQQGERYMTYPDGHSVHRTVPFVNSHDTYRPRLDSTGNFLNALGMDSGWNVSNELGGNGKHLDPREPRLSVAYASISAMDGNPDFFIEDVFDIGTTGKRYSHLPTDTTDLPIRKDLVNIVQAHQKLYFKAGTYKVPTSLTGADAPFYQKGNSGDHLVIERSGIAVIGLTDYYDTTSTNNQDEEVYVTVSSTLVGQQLYDYSGAHGITTTEVYPDSRVLIKTAPVGHHIPGARGHGYSIWAPAPAGITVTSVNDLYNYIASYEPSRSHETVQEWEMADDIGDSHCKSLGQGGRLPDNSTKQRVAGKIFTQEGDTIRYKVYPETDGRNLTISLWDLNGFKLAESTGISNSAAPLSGLYVPITPGWIILKVRNTVNSQPGQKCFVNVTYTAPAKVNTHDGSTDPATKVSVWTGNKNTSDVFDCGNWEEGKIPDISTKTIIPGYSEIFPIIKSDFAVGDLVIETGGSVTVDSATLSLGGYVESNGIFDARKGMIEMKGSVAQLLPGNVFTDSTVQGLIINNPSGVDLFSTLQVSRLLTPVSGVLASGGYLFLKSDSTGTARVARSMTSNYITGNVTVERYVAAKNAYRLITAPLITSQTIHEEWQENATSATDNPAPGYGTHITGGTAANGFDQGLANDTSMFYYDWTLQQFLALPSTYNLLPAYYGYLMLVRGDRSINLTQVNPPPTPTVLRGKGPLKTGDQPPISVLANKLFLVGNPYASPVDFTKMQKQNIADRYFVFDPLRGTHGAFVLLEGPDYKPINAEGTYTDSNTLIQSSQAFMIEGGATGIGTLTVTESSKADSDRITFRTASANDQRLQVNLRYLSPVTISQVIADAAMARFDAGYSAAVTDEDAGKPENKDENLGISRNGEKLMTVERRPLVSASDTVFLWMSNMTHTDYSFQVIPTNIPDSISAFLEDTYLNTSTPVDIANGSIIPFSISAVPASYATGRFRIVFINNNVLPLNFTSIKAWQKNNDIQVQWNVAAETNINRYEVEKSATGNGFEKSALIAPKANNNSAVTYEWLDVHPLAGDHYYRIKSVDKSGGVRYSQAVRVKTGSGKGEILIYPNPVKNKSITVQLNNQPKGQYTIGLFSTTGQQVFAAKLNHAGGSATQTYQLGATLSKGIYQLKINSEQVKQTMKIVVD